MEKEKEMNEKIGQLIMSAVGSIGSDCFVVLRASFATARLRIVAVTACDQREELISQPDYFR